MGESSSSKETKKKFTWSKETTIQLIELYQNHPILYMVADQNYKNKNLRQAALENIRGELLKLEFCSNQCLNINDIKAKIHTLRTQYFKWGKVKASERSGTGIDLIYQPKLWCYEELAFLKESECTTQNFTNLDEQLGAQESAASVDTSEDIGTNEEEAIEITEPAVIPPPKKGKMSVQREVVKLLTTATTSLQQHHNKENSMEKDDIYTFGMFPKDSERRKKWEAFLGLPSTYNNHNDIRVCSSHFPKDDFIIKPAGKHYLKSTALPILRDGQSLSNFPDMKEIQLGRCTDDECMEPQLKKLKRHCMNLRAWSVDSSQISSSNLTASGSFISIHSETDEESKQPKTKEAYSQTTFIWKEWKTLKTENKQLKEENSMLRKRIKELEKNEAGEDINNFVESLKQSDKKCKFYTSLTFTSILTLFSFLQPIEPLQYWGCKNSKVNRPLRKKNNPLQELIIVLIRLRTGLLIEDIHYRFNISTGLVTKLFTSWIQHIYCKFNILRPMMFPSRDMIKQHLPTEFQRLKNIRVIIDCTEFYCQVPNNFEHQSNLYSSYKAHTTFKVLIGCTPNGAISFISDLFEGSISDKELVKKSNLMDLLDEGDLVLADRGFDIKELTNQKKNTLNIPPFLKGRDKLTPEEEIETKIIAKKRIYVEHVVGRIKSFRLLKKKLPLSMRGILSQVVFVTACLVNFQEPILKEENNY